MPIKVLIVDDDPDVRLFNSSVVQELGYLPIEARKPTPHLRVFPSSFCRGSHSAHL